MMNTIKVDFTTIQGYTVTGTFKDDDPQNIVRMIKNSISLNKEIYIGNGVYVQPQHIFTFSMMVQ